MNVLVIGARIVGSNLAVDLVKSYLSANFTERNAPRAPSP